MPSSAEAEARKRGGVKAYRTVKRGDRTILVAVVPQAGPRGGHTVAMAGPSPVKQTTPKRGKMTKKKLRALAKKRRRRETQGHA